ncbi:copper chaperone PCu(A)C [Streptomyces sp. NBC_00237]|uniref:copper chaperone PCu(A)C n=1 Tax=Streptomyces sp. NBC_00237 TaxID=2975687 RepID=UPI00224CF7B7|nr:copper chaperone PCu(A)C [Streptomyces sp. NBC_00237]MCX5199982.1 copper chaperone PCu(A)C [Streptomyces sp. NBC_00237]
MNTRTTRSMRYTARLTTFAAIAVAGSLALTACGGDAKTDKTSSAKTTAPAADSKPKLAVTGAFIPEPAMPDMAGGFLTVKNTGSVGDRLTSVTASAFSGKAEIHETTKDGKMKEAKNGFPVLANGTLELKRGGNHIMFLDVKKKPKKGDKIAVELHFEKAGTVKVDMPVEAATHNPQQHH